MRGEGGTNDSGVKTSWYVVSCHVAGFVLMEERGRGIQVYNVEASL